MQPCLLAPSAKANPASAVRACACRSQLWKENTGSRPLRHLLHTLAHREKVCKACARLFSSEFCRLKWEKWRAEGIMFFIQRWAETPSWWVINTVQNTAVCMHCQKCGIKKLQEYIFLCSQAGNTGINCRMYRMYFSIFIQYSEYTQKSSSYSIVLHFRLKILFLLLLRFNYCLIFTLDNA
jgi:hypothetical protein